MLIKNDFQSEFQPRREHFAECRKRIPVHSHYHVLSEPHHFVVVCSRSILLTQSFHLFSAVASSQQDIQKIDEKMNMLEYNIQNQDDKLKKLDRMEQIQLDTNKTLTQITKWIR